MKTLLISILILAVTIIMVLAATLTIDIPANDVPRVSEAYGSILGLGRNATVNEVQAAEKQNIINQTKDYERRKNMVTYTPPPMEMQPTPSPTATVGVLRTTTTAVTPSPTATPTPKKKGWW